MDDDAIERRVEAAEIVQGTEDRHVESGQICHGKDASCAPARAS
jgi:hypothetical protein